MCVLGIWTQAFMIALKLSHFPRSDIILPKINFLISSTQIFPRLILYILESNATHFSKNSWFILVGNLITRILFHMKCCPLSHRYDNNAQCPPSISGSIFKRSCPLKWAFQSPRKKHVCFQIACLLSCHTFIEFININAFLSRRYALWLIKHNIQ